MSLSNKFFRQALFVRSCITRAILKLLAGWKSATDAAEREQSVLAYFAEPQGGKARNARLIYSA